SFLAHPSGPPCFLHSFPTRRSSDLAINALHRPESFSGRLRFLEIPQGFKAVPGSLARGASGPSLAGALCPFLHCANQEFPPFPRSEEHTSELQSRENLVCRLLLEKK